MENDKLRMENYEKKIKKLKICVIFKSGVVTLSQESSLPK